MFNVHALPTKGERELGDLDRDIGTLWQPGPSKPVTLFRHPSTRELVPFDDLRMTFDGWSRALAAQDATGGETGL